MPHPYLRNTSRTSERKLQRANVRAMNASGMPGYPHLNKQRQELLRKAESKRPLRRSEYIDLYGYRAWLDYCEQHGVDPNDTAWADAHNHKLSSIAGN